MLIKGPDTTKYQNIKGTLSQNVMVVCSFNLLFIFVLPSWEGSTVDDRVLKSTLTREDKLVP